MSYGDQIVTILRADTALSAVLTGGVYLFEDSGPKGINRVQLQNAFNDVTGIIKPLCIINELQDEATGEAIDVPGNFMSTKTPIYGYIYDAGNAGYATIAAAYDLIYADINNMRLTSGFQVLWKSTLKNRQEPLLNDARYYAFYCIAYGFKS